MSLPVIIVILVRIGGYIYTYFAPLPGLILSFVFDFFDGWVFFFMHTGVGYYEIIDKPLDLLQYFMLIPIARKTPAYKAFLACFAIRLIGQVLFFFTGLRYIFILFPNLTEYTLFVYFVFEYFRSKPVTNKFIEFFHKVEWNNIYLWIILIMLKMVQELGLHGPGADARTFVLWDVLAKVGHTVGLR